jgi:OmpA-OmpF porin, OOP family
MALKTFKRAMELNRIYRYLPFLTCFLLTTTLSAQIRLAALGGVHSSNFIQNNSIPGFDTAYGKYFSPSTGFELGVLAEIPFSKNNLFFQPGILFSAKGNQYSRTYDSAAYQIDTLYSQHTLSLNYVEIPLYLTWKYSLAKNQGSHFYISAGFYFAFINTANQSYQNRVLPYGSSKYIYNSGTEDLPVGQGTGKYKTFDIGLSARAGFELGKVMIGAYFSQGLTNAYTAAYTSSFHNQVFGGSLGIWLNNPKTPAVILDADKDGTPDPDDSCKTIPGVPRYHGCPIPDTDLDGINDEMDSCKTIPGYARYHGCPIPDSDQDGINDEEDSCRTVPGSARYHGCPVPDRDHDGMDDEMDNCPDQPGPVSNQGCPVLKAAMIKRAELVAANVMFQVNSSKLTKNSYPGIQELSDSLKANPDLDLVIEGHTDNTGSPSYNLELSKERADAVKKALLKMGIEESRIEAKGYGDSKPIADNHTVSGRAQNRRVVFVFLIRKR